MSGTEPFDPREHRALIEHVSEVTVLIALMGVGPRARPAPVLPPARGWGRWAATWKLLGIAMPLSIAGVALLGWWGLGIAPAAALLLGAALAPTDPVLASDVQVEGPSVEQDAEEIDEEDEVRFALTSEAGLNDGLAFPFLYAAVFLATLGPVSEWGWRWIGWELVGKTLLGVAVGVAVGWLWAASPSGRGRGRCGSRRPANRSWRSRRCSSPTAPARWSAATASSPCSPAR